MMEIQARLPSIRELELSCSQRPLIDTSAAQTKHSTYSNSTLTSPTYSQFPSPTMLTPTTSGTRASADRRVRHTSIHRAEPIAGRQGLFELESDIAPLQGLHFDSTRIGAAPQGHPGSQPHQQHKPQMSHMNAELACNMSRKRPHTITPPRSPDRVTLITHSSSNGTEVSTSSNDDVIAESRRQRRESKERRRRRDQRGLTVRMEQSVPSWVFGRLKTRHSASKVNGGGRATNAVISGACIWLRVQERAMNEGILHWSQAQGKGREAAMERWMQLVDEEAISLENWNGDDCGISGCASIELD